MIESSQEHLRDSRRRYFTGGTGKLMQVLKKDRKIHLQEDGILVYERIKPQDHGIKKALLQQDIKEVTFGDMPLTFSVTKQEKDLLWSYCEQEARNQTEVLRELIGSLNRRIKKPS